MAGSTRRGCIETVICAAFDGDVWFEEMRRQGNMTSLQRLERFWRNLISEQKLTLGTEVSGAVISCWPEIPSFRLNHAANIDVSEEEAESLLNRVTEYFLSRGVLSFGFRVSPLTRPESFVSLLEDHGFKREDEDSVMVFKGERPKDGPDTGVDLTRVEESEIGLFSEVSVKAYEMPLEWTQGFSKMFLQRLRRGGRHYLAYVEDRPVGTCALISAMKTGGVFSVGTLREYRGRGVATAMTLRAVKDSLDDGNTFHTLQTEKGGYPEQIYKRLGFETDHTVAFFVKTVKE